MGEEEWERGVGGIEAEGTRGMSGGGDERERRRGRKVNLCSVEGPKATEVSHVEYVDSRCSITKRANTPFTADGVSPLSPRPHTGRAHLASPR